MSHLSPNINALNSSDNQVTNQINVYYQNVRGLNIKTTETLLNSTSMTQFDLIILTETWLSANVGSGKIFYLGRYDVFRKDRDFVSTQTSRGGGVLIAVSKNFQTVEVDPLALCQYFRALSNIDLLPYTFPPLPQLMTTLSYSILLCLSTNYIILV